jgi:hypothetical protein
MRGSGPRPIVHRIAPVWSGCVWRLCSASQSTIFRIPTTASPRWGRGLRALRQRHATWRWRSRSHMGRSLTYCWTARTRGVPHCAASPDARLRRRQPGLPKLYAISHEVPPECQGRPEPINGRGIGIYQRLSPAARLTGTPRKRTNPAGCQMDKQQNIEARPGDAERPQESCVDIG